MADELGTGQSAVADNQGMTAAPVAEQSVSGQPSASSPSADNTAWIGGVKKEARQKGYEEGYHAAQEEIKRQLMQDSTPSPQASIPNQPESHSQQSSVSTQKPDYNPEEIAQQAAKVAAAQMQAQHYQQVDAKARQQFADYDEKMQQFTQLVNEYDQNPALKPYADDMRNAIAHAANTGNPSLVYQVAADENFRNDLLATHPRLWQQKLLQRENQPLPPLSDAQKMAAQRVQGEPTQNMPQTASYGEMSEPSWAELRRQVRGS